jgi:hypothetical protein
MLNEILFRAAATSKTPASEKNDCHGKRVIQLRDGWIVNK